MTAEEHCGISGPLSRERLARLLSRLAALQGVAVPAFRFFMPEHGRHGVAMDELPPVDQAREMWLIRFAEGWAEERPSEHVAHRDLPLLWLPPSVESIAEPLLLRGQTSSGSCLCEDAAGEVRTLPRAELVGGVFLSLTAPDRAGGKDKRPRTATEWFIHTLRRQRGQFGDAILATFLVNSLALFAAMYTMQVYDRVVPTRGYSTLWVLTVGVLLAAGFEFLLRQVRSAIVDRASKQIDLELSSVFFGKALDIRLDARPATVGTFASQIRQFESVRAFLTSSTLFILADAPFALFFIGVIALLAGPVALVPTVMLPVAVLVGLLTHRRLREYVGAHMEETNRKNGLLIEAVDGIESIKAAGAGWKVLDQHQNLTSRIAEDELKIRGISTRASALGQTVQQLNYIAMICVGAYAITNGELTMGALIACSIISGRALAPIGQIPQLIGQWSNARMALKTLNGIMNLPDDREGAAKLIVPESCTGNLSFETVKFSYAEGGDKPALTVENMAFRPGERVGVIGPVGSGKSTFIKIAAGLFKPAEGRVLLDGVNMQHLAPDFVREHVGYLPQDVRLFHGTLRENLIIGLPVPNDGLILEAAAKTSFDQVIASHPKGLERMIAEGGRGLSGGQRQLVGLTRLLLARPRILLLDEPTAAMDGKLEARVIAQIFAEFAPNTLILIVTHKTALLSDVDRIIVFDRGRPVLDDARDRVLEIMMGRKAVRPEAVLAPAAQRLQRLRKAGGKP